MLDKKTFSKNNFNKKKLKNNINIVKNKAKKIETNIFLEKKLSF